MIALITFAIEFRNVGKYYILILVGNDKNVQNNSSYLKDVANMLRVYYHEQKERLEGMISHIIVFNEDDEIRNVYATFDGDNGKMTFNHDCDSLLIFTRAISIVLKIQRIRKLFFILNIV